MDNKNFFFIDTCLCKVINDKITDIVNDIKLNKYIYKNNFTKNLEELEKIFKDSQKIRIVEFLKNNFKENVHYVMKKNINIKKKRGGHNKISYLMTEEVYEFIKNSFNLKNRYVKFFGSNNCINIVMSLENQTVGFIENSFNKVIKTKRQSYIDGYKIDLYFCDYKLAIECDENNHEDRNIKMEKERQDYILSKGITMIRFDPNNEKFDLSYVFREILTIILNKSSNENINIGRLIIVNFT